MPLWVKFITLPNVTRVLKGGKKLILKRYWVVRARGLFLQRYGIGLILRRLLIQQGYEFAAGSGDANLAFADDLLGSQISAIQLFVCTAVRPERRALERDTCEQPP